MSDLVKNIAPICNYYSLTIVVGFLCGKCPDGEGVDLTLRQCKRCTIGDVIAVTVIGRSNHTCM